MPLYVDRLILAFELEMFSDYLWRHDTLRIYA